MPSVSVNVAVMEYVPTASDPGTWHTESSGITSAVQRSAPLALKVTAPLACKGSPTSERVGVLPRVTVNDVEVLSKIENVV
jgi:hypothetical protein